MHCIRGELAPTRAEAIRKAFAKLDSEGTNSVCLDDIAKHYNVTGSRDCQSEVRSQEQHYATFMGLWGTNDAAAKVSYEQF